MNWVAWAAVLRCPCRLESGKSTGMRVRLPMLPHTDGRRNMKLEAKEFERLALEQIDLLYRIARRLARDPNRAEDLVQETYVRALRARESFDMQVHGIRPWLLRIMHNVHVSRSEREGRQPAAMEDDQLESSARAGGGV